MMRISGFGHVYITRRTEEKYDPACCVPKFRIILGLMVHGSISSVSKGPLIIFDQKEKVNADIYQKKVLPHVHCYIQQMAREIEPMRGILMEDNTSVHIATSTRAMHVYYRFNKMVWPANSPD
jgi:hypothetical protein